MAAKKHSAAAEFKKIIKKKIVAGKVAHDASESLNPVVAQKLEEFLNGFAFSDDTTSVKVHVTWKADQHQPVGNFTQQGEFSIGNGDKSVSQPFYLTLTSNSKSLGEGRVHIEIIRYDGCYQNWYSGVADIEDPIEAMRGNEWSRFNHLEDPIEPYITKSDVTLGKFMVKVLAGIIPQAPQKGIVITRKMGKGPSHS